MSDELIKHPNIQKQIYQEVCGDYVFDTGNGYLRAHHLRSIADHLEEINQEIDEDNERQKTLDDLSALGGNS